MEYKITENARNFIVRHFTTTKGLPFSMLEIQNLLNQITPVVEEPKNVESEVKEQTKSSEEKS